MFALPVVISVSLIMLAYFSELSMMNRSAAFGQIMLSMVAAVLIDPRLFGVRVRSTQMILGGVGD